jgi:hypothetical protein
MSVDRRRDDRFQVHGQVIVLQPSGIHRLRNISLGGLSFDCPRDVALAAVWPLDIMVTGSLLRVIRVRVRMVRERPGFTDPLLAPGKEVGVEYLDLDPQNRPLLNRLLVYLQQTTMCTACK